MHEFFIHFAVSIFNMICQSNHILDMLGSSDKYIYAS